MQVGSGKIVEVEPSGGTLVIFESRRVWHEVLPSMRRLRFALTLWVYAAPVAPTFSSRWRTSLRSDRISL